jgi:predicted RNA-binding protein with PIN domain
MSIKLFESNDELLSQMRKYNDFQGDLVNIIFYAAMNPAASTYKVKSVAPYIENFAN